MCRQKKVKCDGQWPCRYCAKRQLNCEFGMIDKRRMYSVSCVPLLPVCHFIRSNSVPK